jgi:hypothetical protein
MIKDLEVGKVYTYMPTLKRVILREIASKNLLGEPSKVVVEFAESKEVRKVHFGTLSRKEDKE